MTRDKQDALDLVNDAFAAAVERWEQVGQRDLGGQTAWLKTVCRRRFIDRLRHRKLVDQRAKEVGRHQHRDPATPEETVMGQDTVDRVRKLMGTRPPMQHLVAWMCWSQGLPKSEVASALGIKAGTGRYHRSCGVRRGRPRAERAGGPFAPAHPRRTQRVAAHHVV